MKRKVFSNSEYETWVGQPIMKFSDKPFKNGKKTNVVKQTTINPHSGKMAFEVEDGSVVNCEMCYLKQ